MSLASALAEGPPKDPRRKCGVADWLNTLAPVDRDQGLAALKDEAQWSIEALHKVFVQSGYDQTSNPLTRHRLGKCSCVTR